VWFRPVRSEEPGTMPAGSVLVVVVATLVVALLLSAAAIERKAAGRRPNSDARRGIAAVVGGISEALGLDRPEAALDDTLGPYIGHEQATGDRTSEELASEARATNGAGPSAGVPRVRAAGVDRPLKLWVGGDSISGELGAGLARLAGQTRLFDVVRDTRASTGLTRPDFFNWPEHLLRDVAPPAGGGVHPDVVVIMFGGNDDQGIPAWKGRPVAKAGTSEWEAEYRRRVADTMDLLKSPSDERLVVWPGIPVTQPGTLAHVNRLNAIYASEAARRPWVRYFDSWAFLADGDGAFAPSLPNADGRPREMRTRDGIHLTPAGGLRLAHGLYARLATTIDLTAAPRPADPAQAPPPDVVERPTEIVVRG
jgi:hypothetical protein